MARLPRPSRAAATVLAVAASAALFGGGATLAASGASGAGGPARGASPSPQSPGTTAPPSARPPASGASATTSTTAPGARRQPRGTDVALIGDSLTLGIQDQLLAEAKRYGFTVKADAVQGRDIDASMSAIRKLSPGRDLLVVALGTNDARGGLTLDQATAKIEQVFSVVGDKVPVLWVNVYRNDSKAATAAAQTFDTALGFAALRHLNLTVQDWAAFIQDHHDLLGADRIHLTHNGYDVRAGLVASAIADRLGLPPPIASAPR